MREYESLASDGDVMRAAVDFLFHNSCGLLHYLQFIVIADCIAVLSLRVDPMTS